MVSLDGLFRPHGRIAPFMTWGLFWLALAIVGATAFLSSGFDALLRAWSTPEYSHGPLIPLLSLLLFLRQLKTVPIQTGDLNDRWPGVLVIALALVFGLLGNLAQIADITAYAIIIWIYGILLISFGWRTGWLFWPAVLHLVYMLPLPDTLYYKMSAWLQLISSELGVWFLRGMNVPVFLEGNIIDLGVFKLHVAEACSGLRYLFPILSFSYIFAVLYRGPMWHKAVLLVSAAPITVLLNSVRIAITGYIVNNFGLDWVEGATHFFEGWVIFIACILLLFLMTRLMMFVDKQTRKMTLAEALDLDTDGLVTQAMRVRLVKPSVAMITAALMSLTAAGLLLTAPDRSLTTIERTDFAQFPRQLGDWDVGRHEVLTPDVERALKSDDYLNVDLTRGAERVQLFSAWYQDQARGGVHSPEVCLPAAGWEIAWLERVDLGPELGQATPFMLNKAVIQKGKSRLLVYYWFQQRERTIAWDLAAKFFLLIDGVRTGRTDGAIVRLTTAIDELEKIADAEARLESVIQDLVDPLPRFLPGR